MDWSNLKLKVFASSETTTAKGLVYLPKGEKIETIEVTKEGNNFKLKNNPLQGKTSFSIIK